MADTPSYGKRLAQNIVDDVARDEPDRLYARMPRPDWRKDGFRDVSYREVARAVNKLSWWLDERLGPGEHRRIAYAGPHDLRYAFIILACMKTRRSVLPPDSRMTPESRLQLLRASDSTAFVRAESPVLNFDLPSGEASDILLVNAPGLEQLLDEGDVPHYAFPYTFEQVKKDLVMTMHTSGTTGVPKMVHVNYIAFNSADAFSGLEKAGDALGALGTLRLGPSFCSLPCPWIVGIYGVLHMAVFGAGGMVLAPSNWFPPFNVKDTLDLIEASRSTTAWFVPSTLRDIVKAGEAERLARLLKAAQYCGAPLDPFVGEELFSRGLRLISGPGSTETAGTPVITEPPEDWMWYRFHPACGLRFDSQGGKNSELHEMVVERKPELEAFQSVFQSFPDLQEFRSGDLYTEHPDPTKKGAWKYAGRKDDLAKLSDLTKFHTDDVAQQISKIARVKDVIVGGSERPALFLLLKLDDSPRSSNGVANGTSHGKGIDDDLWASIKAATATNSEDVAIKRELVFVADEARPFMMTLKSTISKTKTLVQYEDEVAAAYKALGLE